MPRLGHASSSANLIALFLIGATTLGSPATADSKDMSVRFSMGAEMNNRPVTVTDDFIDEIGPITSKTESNLALLDAELEFALRRSSRRNTLFRMRTTVYRYTEASERDFEAVRLSVVQEINDTSHDLASVRTRRDDLSERDYKLLRSFTVANRSRLVALYLTTPNRTLREAVEIGPGAFGSLMVDRGTLQLRYTQRLNRSGPNRYSLEFAAARDRLDYSDGFDERDSTRNRIAVAGNWYRLADRGIWRLKGGIQSSHLSSNTGMIGQPGLNGPIVADLGYHATTVPLAAGFEWYRKRSGRLLSRRNSARLQLSVGEKTYESTLAADADRFGRKDSFWVVNGQYTHVVLSNLTLDFWGEYRTDRLTFDPFLVPGVNPEQPEDNVVIGFAVNVYSGWQIGPNASTRRAQKRMRSAGANR